MRNGERIHSDVHCTSETAIQNAARHLTSSIIKLYPKYGIIQNLGINMAPCLKKKKAKHYARGLQTHEQR